MNTASCSLKAGRILLTALLCLALSSIVALVAAPRAFAATDEDYNKYRDVILTIVNAKGVETNNGTLSISAAAATSSSASDIDGIVTIDVGGTTTITVSPYQHVQWRGCRMWQKCPEVCDKYSGLYDADTCFTPMYGCVCNTTPSLETIDLTTTIGDSSVLSVSDVAVSAVLTETTNNVSKTNDGTLTLTGLADGTTTITVAADGLYFWWPCTKTYKVVVGTGGDPEPADPEPDLVGDVNDNGAVSIVDAQIVLDMSNGVWTETTTYDKLLAAIDNDWTLKTLTKAADVNADGKVDATDARAIQTHVHTGSFA